MRLQCFFTSRILYSFVLTSYVSLLQIADNQKMLLGILRSEPTITQKEIIEWTSLSRSTIQRAIKELIAMGRLERIGSKKSGSWVVKENIFSDFCCFVVVFIVLDPFIAGKIRCS